MTDDQKKRIEEIRETHFPSDGRTAPYVNANIPQYIPAHIKYLLDLVKRQQEESHELIRQIALLQQER